MEQPHPEIPRRQIAWKPPEHAVGDRRQCQAPARAYCGAARAAEQTEYFLVLKFWSGNENL
jgi:hypothetical protein